MSLNFNSANPETIIKQILNNAKNKIKQAEIGKNWNQVFVPLDTIEKELNQSHSIHSHLNNVCFTEDFNQKYEKTLVLISDFYSEMGTNKKLYSAFKNLATQKLNIQQKYILKNVIRDFKLSGIQLNSNKQQKFKKMSANLSLLSNNFAKNSLQATNSYIKKVSKEKLKGLSVNELEKLKTKNGYFLNLQTPQYLSVMTYCNDAKIRQELYTKYISRASEFDGFDNANNMQQILNQRFKLALILDFKNYADYSLASKMVKQTKKIEKFLNELIKKSRPKAQIELQELQEFANKNLKPWDLLYYSEKLKQQKHGFNKAQIAEYFPFTQVLNGLISLIEDLYNLKISIIQEKTYHPDVVVLKFQNIGKLYLDPFARKNKKNGAWMSDYQGLNQNSQPIAFVVCNFNSPTKNLPSLLEFDDIVTIFHEFGHALHHLLTEVKYPSVAGINGVPWDGVELPSQYMEFFAYEKAVINKISSHYKTSKTLPNNLFSKLIKSKNFNSGLAMLRQCEFALWDILTHSTQDDIYVILKQVQKQTALIPAITKNRFLNTFNHIFSGGYAAGYYSYKWSEVLAADAYNIVKKDKTKTKDFRQYILATGGTNDFMQNYIKFSGKKPKINALLMASGIENTE